MVDIHYRITLTESKDSWVWIHCCSLDAHPMEQLRQYFNDMSSLKGVISTKAITRPETWCNNCCNLCLWGYEKVS